MSLKFKAARSISFDNHKVCDTPITSAYGINSSFDADVRRQGDINTQQESNFLIWASCLFSFREFEAIHHARVASSCKQNDGQTWYTIACLILSGAVEFAWYPRKLIDKRETRFFRRWECPLQSCFLDGPVINYLQSYGNNLKSRLLFIVYDGGRHHRHCVDFAFENQHRNCSNSEMGLPIFMYVLASNARGFSTPQHSFRPSDSKCLIRRMMAENPVLKGQKKAELSLPGKKVKWLE